MMTSRVTVALLFALSAFASSAFADEKADLKERFKDRYPTVSMLKDAGKVGEVATGLLEVVDERYLSESVEREAKKTITVAAFMAAENRDRQRLYELIAEASETTPAKVARRNAQRNFKRARATHFLKTKDGKWLRKKDLKERRQ